VFRAYYRRSGAVPGKRHAQYRAPDGGLYYEELTGEESFSAYSSLLLPRHLRLHALFPDFEPIAGRVHQPPPVHQVFETQNFVICNFVPRKIDYHPLVVPVPYYHSNMDSDEVMFDCGGDYKDPVG